MGKYIWKEIKLINKSTYFIKFLLVNCLLLNLEVSENGYTVKKKQSTYERCWAGMNRAIIID